MKKFIAFVIAMTMLFGLSSAETAQEETEILLATINGQEIKNTDYGYKSTLNYYLNSLKDSGLTSDMDEYHYYEDYYKSMALVACYQHAYSVEKAKELGIEVLPEEVEAYRQSVKEYWDNVIETEMQGKGLTDEMTESEKNSIYEETINMLKTQYGMNEEEFIENSITDYSYYALDDKVTAEMTKDITVTEQEIKDYFDNLVKNDKEAFEGNAIYYEINTINGNPSYFVPEGYRGIKHILIKVDESLLKTYTDLKAKAENNDETVTPEMVEKAQQDVLNSVQDITADIYSRIEKGEEFDALIDKYGTDPGMNKEPYKTSGYPIRKDSIAYDKDFIEGASALKAKGDISEPVVSSFGVHILCYVDDIPSGAVELTDELKAEITHNIEKAKAEEMMNNYFMEWLYSSDLEYTDDGNKLVDAADKAEDYLNSLQQQ